MGDWRDYRTIAVIDRGPAGPASTVAGPPGKTGPPGQRGPAGERGSIGLTGERGPAGEQGERGEPGTSVKILGSFDTLEELQDHHPSGSAGDGFLIEGVLYVWDAENNEWTRAGNIRGPAGEAGERGERGEQGERGLDGERGQDGERGPTGEPGFVGRNAFTLTITAPFVVPPIGQTVTVEVEQAEWIVAGQMVWVANAAGPNRAAAFEVTAVDGDEVTLLNPPPAGQLAGAILTGMIIPFGGEVAPFGYLFCDGESYPRVLYPELAEVLGTHFGGDADNFNVPDCRGRVLAGAGANSWVLGGKYGAYMHQLTIAELAAHSHGVPQYTAVFPSGTSAWSAYLGHTDMGSRTYNTGDNAAHNNVQPSLGISYVIRT